MEQDTLLSIIYDNQNIVPIMLRYVKKSNVLEQQAGIKKYQYFSNYYQTSNHSFRLFLYKPYF
jgi:hypothetical protein